MTEAPSLRHAALSVWKVTDPFMPMVVTVTISPIVVGGHIFFPPSTSLLLCNASWILVQCPYKDFSGFCWIGYNNKCCNLDVSVVLTFSSAKINNFASNNLSISSYSGFLLLDDNVCGLLFALSSHWLNQELYCVILTLVGVNDKSVPLY